ncbi:apolipoprotein N-acyltransferase [Sulfurimonas sp.]
MNQINLKNLFIGIVCALLLSAFIYLANIDITNKLLNTLLALLAYTMLLYMPKKAILSAGFFIGLLWFYWIGYSFEYQGVGYMTPIITFAFGVIYLLFFLPLYFTDRAYIRAVLLFGLSFIEPFDWNWMQLELPFVESYIGIYKYQFALVLIALSLPQLVKNKRYKYLPLLLLLASVNYGYKEQLDAPLKIKLIQTDIKQEDKWTPKALSPTVDMIFNEIKKATDEQYDLIIFPESVFPLYMNRNPALVKTLLKASHSIAIVAGALLAQNNQHYNVSYLFENGTYKVAKKLVLVPFGEYIPLPKFAQKIINDTFFGGASDFVTAKKPTDFIIKGIKFRNAICYEATCQEIYEGDVKYVIAMSNNAWFAPSIEPTLQNLLLKYYARKNGVTIYHAANYKGTGVIK